VSTTTSTWIRWPGYLAWGFLALLCISILMVRAGNWQQGLLIYALSGLLSLIVLAWFAVQFLLPRFGNDRGSIFKHALPALPGAVLLVVALQGREVPAIHDITTDTQDPPRFETVPTLRDEASNPLELSEEVIEQQLAAYPDLRTLQSQRSYASSYNLALETARKMGWKIVREDPNAGFIEAVATTPIMQFKDDVVIRVRTNADGSLIDVRSASRVGVSDLGANAERIRRFLDAFKAAAAD